MIKLLKFHATWCAPCKALSSTIESVKGSIPYPVEEIDIDVHNDIAMRYAVRGVPTLVLVDGEKEVKRSVGNMNATQLKTFLGV